jgi:hypothetical protein
MKLHISQNLVTKTMSTAGVSSSRHTYEPPKAPYPPQLKPILVDRDYLWQKYRLGRGKLALLVEEKSIKVIRSTSKISKWHSGKASRPKVWYVLSSVDAYFAKLAQEQGVSLE